MNRATKSDIRTRVNEILEAEWPDIGRKSLEDCDRAIQPYFVVEVREKPVKKERNLWFYRYDVFITYNPRTFDQVKQSKMADRLEELIGMIFSVKGRHLTVEDWESEYLDKKLTQCQFSLRETVNVVKAETEEPMADLDITISRKEDLNG